MHYEQDQCRQPTKKNASVIKMCQNPKDTDGLAPQRFPSPHAMRRRVRRVGAAAPARRWTTLLQLALYPDRRRARPARIRGLPDADHAHLHTTDHARHAQHAVSLSALAALSLAPDCSARGRDATAATA